jgi:hypothetical protein
MEVDWDRRVRLARSVIALLPDFYESFEELCCGRSHGRLVRARLWIPADARRGG